MMVRRKEKEKEEKKVKEEKKEVLDWKKPKFGLEVEKARGLEKGEEKIIRRR